MQALYDAAEPHFSESGEAVPVSELGAITKIVGEICRSEFGEGLTRHLMDSRPAGAEEIPFDTIVSLTKQWIRGQLSPAKPNEETGKGLARLQIFNEAYVAKSAEIAAVFRALSSAGDGLIIGLDKVEEFMRKLTATTGVEFRAGRKTSAEIEQELAKFVIDMETQKGNAGAKGIDCDSVVSYIRSYVAGNDAVSLVPRVPTQQKQDKEPDEASGKPGVSKVVPLLKLPPPPEEKVPAPKVSPPIEKGPAAVPMMKPPVPPPEVHKIVPDGNVSPDPGTENEFYANLRKTIKQYEDLVEQQKSRGENAAATRNLVAMLRSQLKRGCNEPEGTGRSKLRHAYEADSQASRATKAKDSAPIEEQRETGIKEIFAFYCRQQRMYGKNITFDQLNAGLNNMNMGEFMRFCKDFQVPLKPPKVQELFKRYAKLSRNLDLDRFVVFPPPRFIPH